MGWGGVDHHESPPPQTKYSIMTTKPCDVFNDNLWNIPYFDETKVGIGSAVRV